LDTQYLTLPHGKIAYDDTGLGPLVVCAPSLGDLRSEYRFLTPQLVAAGFRVVTMDLRGLGESSPNWPDYSVGPVGSDMLALVRSLDAGPAILIGTSMAAGAAVWAAAEAPKLVAGLVLIGPFVRGETSRPNALLYRLLFARPWGPAAWLKYYQTLYPSHKPADFAAYSATLQANLKQAGRLEAVRAMLSASKHASEARLPDVQAPALILMGSRDPDFKQPEAEAGWLADQLSARLVIVPGAGHYPHAELPEITEPEIISFLEALAGENSVFKEETNHAA
jgi:pimeloyl-ACP methyl ester carboxylesterase